VRAVVEIAYFQTRRETHTRTHGHKYNLKIIMGGKRKKRKKKHTQSCTKEKGKLDYVEKTTASEYFYIAFGLLGFFEEIVLVESFSSSFHQGQETTLEKKRE